MDQETTNVLDHLLEGCQIIGPDWRYIYVNDAVTKQGKKTKKQLLGNTMMAVYPGIDKSEMFSYLRNCMETKKPETMENEFDHPDGSKGWFELRMEPVPEGVLIFSLDITKRKQAEQAQREFLILASHHLLTPLSEINLSAGLVADEDLGKLTEPQKKYMAQVVRAGKHASQLVNELLNIARVAAGDLSVNPQPVNVNELMKQVLADFEQPAAVKRLVVQLNEAKIPIIQTDHSLLRLIFESLISNAINFTAEGGKVSIKLGADNQLLRLAVTDTGFGIPSGEQERVFSRFFRASNISSRDYIGPGLGLSLANDIAVLLGGKLSFTSQENKGSVFTLEIPMTPAQSKGGEPVAVEND